MLLLGYRYGFVCQLGVDVAAAMLQCDDNDSVVLHTAPYTGNDRECAQPGLRCSEVLLSDEMCW